MSSVTVPVVSAMPGGALKPGLVAPLPAAGAGDVAATVGDVCCDGAESAHDVSTSNINHVCECHCLFTTCSICVVERAW